MSKGLMTLLALYRVFVFLAYLGAMWAGVLIANGRHIEATIAVILSALLGAFLVESILRLKVPNYERDQNRDRDL